MFDTLLLVVLPYLAIVICIAGTIYRVRCTPLTYSSLSSQFLESNGLKWGSLPWHLGIITLICAHILALLCPPIWQSLMANETILMFTESVGLGLGILSLFGLFILAVRRLTSANIQAAWPGRRHWAFPFQYQNMKHGMDRESCPENQLCCRQYSRGGCTLLKSTREDRLYP